MPSCPTLSSLNLSGMHILIVIASQTMWLTCVFRQQCRRRRSTSDCAGDAFVSCTVITGSQLYALSRGDSESDGVTDPGTANWIGGAGAQAIAHAMPSCPTLSSLTLRCMRILAVTANQMVLLIRVFSQQYRRSRSRSDCAGDVFVCSTLIARSPRYACLLLIVSQTA
jgi:hypothetical protein